MLKLAQVLARLHINGGIATVKQMRPQLEDDFQRAQNLIGLFQEAVKQNVSRDELDLRLARFTGARLDYREIDGLAKVICDSFTEFRSITGQPKEAENEDEQSELAQLSRLRLAVWREVVKPEFSPFANPALKVALTVGSGKITKAVASHDETLLAQLLPESKKETILRSSAYQSGFSLNNSDEPLRVGDVLFSDLAGRHKLIALSAELTVENLLNRYNVELLRGVLYLAPRLIIRVHDNYKDLFKFIKLFGLMHETRPLYSKSGIEGDESSIEGYEILLEGAVSPFLARTDRRYGIQFARFLPALLLCEADWELEAELVTGFGKNALFKLKPQPHLRSHFKGSGEFDSQLEQSLAISFEEKFGTGKQKERKGWAIQREDRIIPVFDTVMIPDFSFEHTDGRRVLLEIMGFWQPQYLERKIAKLNRAGRRDLIVMVSERTRCGREHFSKDGQEPVYPVIFFKGVPRLGQVMEALERWAI